MVITEADEEVDLLPADWLTEGVQEASCRKVGGGWHLALKAAPGTRYFGVRLAASRAAVAFSTGQVSFAYNIVSQKGVAGLHLVLREWRQAGPFNFQSQKALPLISDSAQAELCLSVRESGMAIEPVLLFEAAAVEDSSEATVFIDDLRFDVT